MEDTALVLRKKDRILQCSLFERSATTLVLIFCLRYWQIVSHCSILDSLGENLVCSDDIQSRTWLRWSDTTHQALQRVTMLVCICVIVLGQCIQIYTILRGWHEKLLDSILSYWE